MLAGFMIGIGAIANLTLGGIAGAVFFSVGLMTILVFKFDLFTGKAGLLSQGATSPKALGIIWVENLIGTMFAALGTWFFPSGPMLRERAAAIVDIRNSNDFITNFVLGIFCGLLMYVAVTGFQETKNMVFAVWPVAVFILAGMNHCVADMFYVWLGGDSVWDFASVIATSAGNVFGANLIPLFGKNKRSET